MRFLKFLLINRFLKYILSLLLFFTVVCLFFKILPLAKKTSFQFPQKLSEQTYEDITKKLAPLATIASVGGKPISKQDIDYKKKVEIAYTDKEDEGSVALLKILRESAYENLLYKFGLNITKEELEQEYQRIHKETLAPDSLKKMEDSFSNHEAFLNIFVKPVLVYKKLEKYFEENRTQFDPLKNELKEKLRKIKNGEILENNLEANQIANVTIPPKPETNNRQNQATILTNMVLSDNEIERIKNLKNNEFADEIFDSPEFYYLIKADKAYQDNIKSYTIFLFNKKIFGDWLKEQLNNVEIKLSDSRLKSLLKKNFPLADIINSIR